uniref:Uncharacterized protein n=1 Tax=Anguilla anguilla TaxID=7936 RepID=A0A0E9STB3_ANGAN
MSLNCHMFSLVFLITSLN